MRLAGKKVLVTGAGRGIGRAVAVRFAREGADVAITARKAESLRETAEAVEAEGRACSPMAWDVLETSRATERLAEARDALGGLDILVNNAGVVRLPSDHAEPTTEAAWDYIMDINLKGLYFIAEAAAEMMRQQSSGAIVNIASDAGMRAAPTPYGISKWGVIGYTKGLAQRMIAHGVRVNGIAPGPVATEMSNWRPGDSLDAPSLPLGRYTLPEEVAAIALFLATPESSAVIGHTIVVNTANT